MHKTNYKQIALAVCFAFLPISAHSAGLGKLTVISGLGEPLQAEIDLVSTTPEELSSLSAAIAPQETYAVQGMERRAIHAAIQIEVGTKTDGSPVLKLVSRQPVEDPFLDMLIQVDWATGRLLREYTVLLDPPGYNDAQPVMATTQSQALAEPSQITAAAVPPAEAAAGTTSTSAAMEYTSKSGDTLSKVAREMQIEGVSLDQMLVGLYRTNKDAFAGDNMNRLKVGQIIKAPSHEELTAVSAQEAAQEVRVQTADWNAYRNKLAAVVAESDSAAADAGNQAASGKLKTATEDKALPADTGPRDIVKLSRSEAASDSAEARALQERLAAMQEENTARQKNVEEANERVAMLEKQIADLQALLTIKDSTLAGLQEPAATLPEADMTPTEVDVPQDVQEDSGTTATETEAPVEKVPQDAPQVEAGPQAKTEAAKKSVPPAPVEAPGLLEGLTDNAPLLGLAGGAILLLGGGWMFIRNRRKRNLDSFEQGILTAGGLKANTVFGNTSGGTVDTGDTSFLTNFSQNPSGMIDTHDVDPIAEAEVYMAYGRDSQAEEILNDAISKEPTRYELHLKLLEIFVARNDTSAFEAVAGELYSTLGSDDPVWVQIAQMGQKLEPTNPLYDNSKTQTSQESTDADKLAATTMLTAAAASPEPGRLDASDFESAELMSASSLDFSLDSGNADVENAGSEVDDVAKAADDGLDFNLDFASTPDVSAESTEATSVEEADTAFADAQSPDADTLDFNMDFSIDGESAEPTDDKPADDKPADDKPADDKPADDKPTVTEAMESPTDDTVASGFDQTLPDIAIPSLSFDRSEPDETTANESEEQGLTIGTEPDLSGQAVAFDVEVPEQEAEGTGSALDFNFDMGGTPTETAESQPPEPGMADDAEPVLELDLSGITLDLGAPAQDSTETADAVQESEDVNTKLDLVTAYMDMGDSEGARELLEEVLKEGGPKQRQRAQELFASLS